MSTVDYRKSTIKDVAAHAGVSITTVSHFVSGRARVCSEETATRIQRAVSELHYTPGYLGRGLRQQDTKILGVCIQNPSDTQESPFTDRIWRGINTVASSLGHSILHYPDSIRNGHDYRNFLDGHISGLILGTDRNDRRPVMLADAGMPTILLTRFTDIPSACGAVYADEADTIDLALSHLWELGHRRIAYVAGPIVEQPGGRALSPNDAALWRLEAFRAWLIARNAMANMICYDGVSLGDCLSVWKNQLEPPTAIVCFNDLLALAVMESVLTMEWSVPNDVSVVGIDNTVAGASNHIALTSVEIAGAQIGKESVRLLLDRMDGISGEKCRISIPATELVVRSSTASPRS